jgi:hypothetical protein
MSRKAYKPTIANADKLCDLAHLVSYEMYFSLCTISILADE